MLVDTLLGLIAQAEFTPSEIRQAAIYASIRHELMRPPSAILLDKNACKHLQVLEQWLGEEQEVKP
jgi:hypothetical protein